MTQNFCDVARYFTGLKCLFHSVVYDCINDIKLEGLKLKRDVETCFKESAKGGGGL